jgi:hypothetical protein
LISYRIDVNIIFEKSKYKKIKKSKIKIKNKMDKRLKCKTTEIKYQSEIELLGGQVIE